MIFSLTVPTSAVELAKMSAGAYREFAAAHGRKPYDNEIAVTITHDAIIMSFEAERRGSSPAEVIIQ